MNQSNPGQKFVIEKMSADGEKKTVQVNVKSGLMNDGTTGAITSQMSIYVASLALSWLLVVSQLKMLGYYYNYLITTDPMSTSFAWDTVLLMVLVGSLYTTKNLIHYAWQWVLKYYEIQPVGYVQQWINMSAHAVHKFSKAFTMYMTFVIMIMWSYYIYGKQIDDISGLSTILYQTLTGFWTNASIYFLAPASGGLQPAITASGYANMLNNYP